MVEVLFFLVATLKTQRTKQRKDQPREMSIFKARTTLSGKVDSYLSMVEFTRVGTSNLYIYL